MKFSFNWKTIKPAGVMLRPENDHEVELLRLIAEIGAIGGRISVGTSAGEELAMEFPGQYSEESPPGN